MRLGRDERQQLVGYLAGEGLSTRAIAPIVGVDRKTVDRDIRGGTNVPPADQIDRDVAEAAVVGTNDPRAGSPLATASRTSGARRLLSPAFFPQGSGICSFSH